MAHVFIDFEIIKAIGLSITFMGVMLSIVIIGISFFIYRLTKRKGKQYLKIAGLVTAWAVFISLNEQSSALLDYKPIFMVYSMAHLISIFVGVLTIITFLFMLPNFWKKNIFDKKLLIIIGIATVLAILMRIVFPFLANPYLSLLQRIILILPSMLGLLIILKSYIGEGGK